MEYLKQFSKDFWEHKITINDHYNYQNTVDQRAEPINDVVKDLTTLKKPVSAGCLPFAKQIVTSNHKISCKIPRIGDLFIGILHQSIIKNVTFLIHNYSEIITIEGLLVNFNSKDIKIWTLSQYPLPLICLVDYENVYIEVCIEIGSNYNLQTANQEVLKAFYGYFNPSLQYQMNNNAICEIPLNNNTNIIKIICGIWTVL